MGIAILVIFSIGLYQVGKWMVIAVMPKRDVAAVADSCTAAVAVTQQSQPAIPVGQSWAGYEAPTFIRRGMPFPVLTKKEKAKRRKVKLKAAPTPEVDVLPMGDWTLFANIEGDRHVTTH